MQINQGIPSALGRNELMMRRAGQVDASITGWHLGDLPLRGEDLYQVALEMWLLDGNDTEINDLICKCSITAPMRLRRGNHSQP